MYAGCGSSHGEQVGSVTALVHGATRTNLRGRRRHPDVEEAGAGRMRLQWSHGGGSHADDSMEGTSRIRPVSSALRGRGSDEVSWGAPH